MKNTIDNHLLSSAWLFFLIFPNNNIFFIAIPIIYLALLDKKKIIDKSTSQFLILLSTLLFISFLFNINETYLDLKSYARAIVLIWLIISFGRLKGSKILAPYIVIAILFLVVTQFSVILNFTALNSIIDRFYIQSEEENSVINSTFIMQDYGLNRLGGIYFNSNNYASYLELILVVLLCEIKQFNTKSLIVLISLFVFSIIATGSRTSLIVLIIITLFFLYSSKIISRKRAAQLTFLLLCAIGVLFLFIDVGNFRAFKIEEGLNDSLGVKVNILKTYLYSDVPVQKILFGNFSGYGIIKYTDINYPGTDFEIGNLIVNYGFVFFISIILFYLLLYKKLLPKYRVVFLILFWVF
jgi:hypothetical protein